MSKRALTDEQKREIVERFFTLWTTGDNKWLRFGQLIENILRDGIYYIEDFELIEELEEGYKQIDKRSKKDND